MKLKKKYPYHIPHGEILLPGILMLTLGTVLSLWAGKLPVNWLIEDQKTSALQNETSKEEAKETPDPVESIITEPVKMQKRLDPSEQKQDQEILNASSFHMASLFPEGTETADPSESYGGQAFANLTERDSRWISGIYGLSQISPKELAANIGKSAGNLPEEWCKISVSFYNGDGAPISGYSNAADILSLASVYSYYQDPADGESFISYAEELWKHSHSYKISISDIYYCNGPCQFSSVKEEEFGDEELAAGSLEELAEEDGSEIEVELEADTEAETAGNMEKKPSQPIGPGAHNLTEAAPENETETTASETEETDSSADSSEAVEHTEIPEGPGAAETVENAEAEETIPTETSESDSSESDAVSSDTETSESLPQEDAENTESAPASMSSAAEAAGLSEAELEELLKQSGPAGYAAYLESVSGEDHSSETSSGAEAAESESEEKTDTEQQTGPNVKKCKGHVDLHVTASIIGIDEKNRNLFSVDTIGNSEDFMTETWNGWTWLPRMYARSLKKQDWFEEYGLSRSSSMYILNPLTASEINYYMEMLPEGTSEQRANVIRQALLSVGSIPYYWGGKPSAPGFEGNGFGTITVPDQKGRTLKGLDCSGWINWVYWSALGERLPQESTSGLSGYGKSIQRSELQPGDLIIRTGTSAHVYLFLSWASDGSMYVIHETGGIANNVTVSKTNVDWPYYRSLFY